QEADDGQLRERFDELLGVAPPQALLGLLGYLETWGLRVIFLIDDFDNITQLLDRADFDHLRTLLTSASLVIVTRKALSKLVPAEVQTSPFFNLVQRLDLRNLYFWPEEEAERMITQPPKWINGAPIQFSPSDVEFILGLTGLQPDLIQRSCEELYLRYARRPSAPGANVVPANERLLIRAQLGALFADSFAALWHRLSEGERSVLTEIVEGKVTVETTLTAALSSVINRGYVDCEKGRYRLFSGLFEDYVAERTGITPLLTPQPVRAQLTDLEQKLLEILRARLGETIEREEIVAALYPEAKTANDNTRLYQSRLDALIFRLRGKLDGEPQQIESVRGQGYRLVTNK
ncbi:MAG TPA: helix-turn-helix domain-containing protein, partial [Roseiflexaceae bacterium]|nr:helix-turn-helix domain-containing protein [Roseiflexaceae bacterium]